MRIRFGWRAALLVLLVLAVGVPAAAADVRDAADSGESADTREPTASGSTADMRSAIGLDGRWHLQRTENLDEYLQKSGASWWRRQLAKLGTSRLRQTIRQDGIRFEIESESPVETRKEAFDADGESSRTIEGADGEEMTWTARIEGDVLVLDGEGERGRRVVRREMRDEALVMTIINPEADAECRMFFERVADE